MKTCVFLLCCRVITAVSVHRGPLQYPWLYDIDVCEHKPHAFWSVGGNSFMCSEYTCDAQLTGRAHTGCIEYYPGCACKNGYYIAPQGCVELDECDMLD